MDKNCNRSSLPTLYLFLFVFVFIFLNQSYHFGDNNHIEQLPHLFSRQDTSYLSNDFFVQYTRELNPRTYYTAFLAYFIRLFPLDLSFYLLTFLANFFILLVSYHLSYRLTKNPLFALSSAVLLTLDHKTNLGQAGQVIDSYLVPQLLATPLVLSAYLFSLSRRLNLSVFLLFAALPLHPSLSVLTSVLMIPNICFDRSQLGRLRLFAVFSGLAIATSIIFPHNFNAVLPAKQFVQIIAAFRHPHHYLPSHFPLRDYRNFSILMLGLFSSLFYLRYSRPRLVSSFFMSILISLAVLLAGYLFVEVFPVRFIVKIQPFRIVFFLRWLGVVCFSSAFFVFIRNSVSRRLADLFAAFTVAAVTLVCLVNSPPLPDLAIRPPSPPKLSLYRYLSQSPKDSLFLAPPDFGDMRLFPKRSIVVDWKSFPFNDDYMVGWYQRINDCYGQGDLDNNYRQITDRQLSSLAEKYHFDYAILYSQTNTNCQVTFNNQTYKIVYCSNGQYPSP